MTTVIISLSYVLAIGIPLFIFAVSLIAIHRSRSYKPVKISTSFAPKCAIILPCKGTPKDLRKNLNSFLNLTYSYYDLYITVESLEDPAVEVIKKVIGGKNHAHLVIAGITRECGQKNHNLIEAVKTIDSTDILIFADADISLSPTWIQDIIAPLQNNDIKVTTGFRWLIPSKASLGALGHSYQNFILFLFFSLSSWVLNTGVWGGSMAIRKKDYDELEIAEVWGKTSVDDMSLSQTLKKANVKTEFVYNAVTQTEDTIEAIHPTMKWFERQVMYLKAHQKPEWIGTLLLSLFGGLMYALFVIGIIGASIGSSLGRSLLSSTILFFILLSLVSTTSQSIGKMKHLILFIFATPFSFLFALIAVLKTLFTDTIIWSGVSYKIRFKDGFVLHVERKPNS